MPNSSGLGTPPSRTLLISWGGLPDNPTYRLFNRLKSLGCLPSVVYHNPTPLNHTITLYTMIICTTTSIPGLYRKIVTLNIKQLYIYSLYKQCIFKHVCSLQEHSSDWLIPPVTARSHHPSGGSLLRRQRGVPMQPWTTDCGPHVQYTIPNYNIRIYTYNRPIATDILVEMGGGGGGNITTLRLSFCYPQIRLKSHTLIQREKRTEESHVMHSMQLRSPVKVYVYIIWLKWYLPRPP